MKKQILFLTLMLLTLVGCGGKSDSVVPEQKGTIINLNVDNVKNQNITDSHIFGFDKNQKLIYYKYYTSPRELNQDMFALETGVYTFVAVLNVGKDFPTQAQKSSITLPQISLLQLFEKITNVQSLYPNMLTGMLSRSVNANEKNIIEITIKEKTQGLTKSKLHLNITLPDAQYPEYQTSRVKSAAEFNLRAVVELYQTGKENCLLHTAAILKPTAELGKYTLDIDMPEGSYDILLWADYSNQGSIADCFYNTQNLKATKIIATNKEYTTGTAAREVFFTKNNATIEAKNLTTDKNLTLERPQAKYIIIAEDIARYRSLMQTNPEKYPDLSNLTINVVYDGFLPDGFNVATGKANSSETGYKYKNPLAAIAPQDTEVQVANDYVLVTGEGSAVIVTVIVTDQNGKKISQVKGVEIKYKPGMITTIKGDFLTAGVVNPGINIDTDWTGTHEVTFD